MDAVSISTLMDTRFRVAKRRAHSDHEQNLDLLEPIFWPFLAETD
jgi:hypothetical protein